MICVKTGRPSESSKITVTGDPFGLALAALKPGRSNRPKRSVDPATVFDFLNLSGHTVHFVC